MPMNRRSAPVHKNNFLEENPEYHLKYYELIKDARIWNNTKIFDFAAGLTIVSEAGGKVTDFKGNQINLSTHDILASNSFVHQE